MSDAKKMNDNELDAVAGGIGDVDMSGTSSGRDTTILDQSVTQTMVQKTETVLGDKIGGDKGDKSETVFGDKTGGSKVDTDVHTNVSVKNSLW